MKPGHLLPPDPETPILPVDARLEVLSADDVAAMLKLDRKSVYAGARAGEIPCRIVGRRFVFVRAAIEAWLLGVAQRGNEQ